MVRKEIHIGKCIYCGSLDDLSDEHTIPFALNGSRILRKASCPSCARTTSQLEGRILQGPLLGIRTVLEMKTRHAKKRPKEMPMHFIRNGDRFVELVPIADYVPTLPLLETGFPGVYPGVRNVKGLVSGEFQVVIHTLDELRGEDHQQMLKKKYRADEMEVPFDVNHEDFLRFFVKIAHCEAILVYGLNAFETFNLQDCILGKTNDVSHWVGSDGMYTLFEQELLAQAFSDSAHIIGSLRKNSTEVWIRVKIWNKSKTPEYIAVVGNLRKTTASFLDFHRVT